MASFIPRSKSLTRTTTRATTRLAVGAAVHGSVPGKPVISIVGGGDLLPGVTVVSDTSLPWLADGVQIAPASLSLELPWTVAPGAVITQPGSNALTVAGYHADAADYLNRVAIADDESLEQPVQWVWDVFFRQMADTDHPAPTAASHKIALQAGTAIPMIGARTLAGALVPLYSGMPSPTNIGFVSGDYDRVDGLSRSGSGKYLDLNHNMSNIPMDDTAFFAQVVSIAATNAVAFNHGYNGSGSSMLSRGQLRVCSSETDNHGNISRLGLLWGGSRHNGSEYQVTSTTGVDTVSRNSDSARPSGNAFAFRLTGVETNDIQLRVVGMSLSVDLTYFGAAVNTLQSSIAAALA